MIKWYQFFIPPFQKVEPNILSTFKKSRAKHLSPTGFKAVAYGFKKVEQKYIET